MTNARFQRSKLKKKIIQNRAQGFIVKLGEAFARPNCGYYSGEGKHGGPDPNPEINPTTGKQRNRRTADNEDDLKEAAIEWCEEEVADGYSKFKIRKFAKN